MRPRRKAIVANSSRTPTVRVVRPALGLPGPKQRAPMPRAAVPGSASGESPQPGVPAAASFALDALGGRPVDLEVDLGRGLVLANPIVAASGPFGYGVEVVDAADLDRLGALVTRGTTLKPRAAHPAPRMAEVPAGLLLGMGPQNPGLETVLDRYAGTWATWAVPVILNLCAESAGELGELVRRLEGAPGVAGIELNLSCGGGGRGGAVPGLDPGAAGSFVAAARRATDLPVIAKLTAAAADVRTVSQACEDAGADAISAINTLPGLALAADRRRPALGSGYGGLCGPALRPIALRVVWEVAQAVDVPVIGIGGVATVEDVLDMLAAGACAVGVGVAALADPMLPVRLADELADACRAAGVAAARDLVGTALPARPAAPSTRGAEYAR
jgi:dihydroorotate dehydrogenase (NAD+) catalytic subunit